MAGPVAARIGAPVGHGLESADEPRRGMLPAVERPTGREIPASHGLVGRPGVSGDPSPALDEPPTDRSLPAPSQSARGPSRRHRPTVASASALTLPPSAPTPLLQPDRPRCAGSSAQSAATTTRAIGQATSPSRGADGQASPEAGSTAPRRLGSRPTRGHPRPRQSPGGTEGHDVRQRRRNRRQGGCGSRDAGGSRSSRRQIGSPAHGARR